MVNLQNSRTAAASAVGEALCRWSGPGAYRSAAIELLALVLLAAVSTLDALTPPPISLALLYLMPLGLATWFGRPGAGWRLMLLAALVWTGLDMLDRESYPLWVLVTVVPEKIVMFGGAVWALQRLRQVMELQDRLNGMLAERLRAAEQLAAGVAHEVRNPLGTLLAGVEYLLRRNLEGPLRALLQDMRDAVGRADIIIRDLLDYSAPLRLLRVPVQASLLLRQALGDASPRATAAQVRLAPEPMPTVELHADRTRIVQVLVNLLHNAIDACAGGGAVRVSVQLLPVGASGLAAPALAIDIDDEGPGIPPEQIERAFEPFFTTKAPGAGSGLGLAVARRIVKDHGGRLTLANRPGRGLRATLLLPIGESPC